MNPPSSTIVPLARTPNLPLDYQSLSTPRPPKFHTPNLLGHPSLPSATHVPNIIARAVNTLSTKTPSPTIQIITTVIPLLAPQPPPTTPPSTLTHQPQPVTQQPNWGEPQTSNCCTHNNSPLNMTI